MASNNVCCVSDVCYIRIACCVPSCSYCLCVPLIKLKIILCEEVAMDVDLQIAFGAFFVIAKLMKNERRKPRKQWIRKLYRYRNESRLLNEMDYLHIKNFTRMTAEDFEILVNLVGPLVMKKDTNLRKAISVQDRLALTLRFLASGDSFTSLQYLFKISKQSISVIVGETSRALTTTLLGHIKIPSNAEQWLRVSKQFFEHWQFPHCLGSMDGKHVVITSPFNSGSEYYNYKSNFSIVLFAVVDADYNFIFVDIGCQGRISDGGVFKHSSIYKKIMDNTLGLPEDQLLHTINKNMPFVFLADEAFALTNRIMKPYSGMHEKGTCQRKFNYRLSRARRVVENAFGILSAVFRVLRKPILLEPEKARYIVMTTVCLHNFLRRNKQSRNIYTPSGTFDEEDGDGNLVPGNWRIGNSSDLSSFLPIKNLPRKSSMDAKEIRNNFAAYFLNT
ncbi:unnamed protein product [Callosobruchus maculatus]|uniref:DDE Tnp4 domain-containing protein n=1 Tax=Callosobruchus maculatus TaxID=64391 RepID=A0A653D540_CALMS|nr:unnamed protein product [Callosobruchus maculatus]